MRRFWVFNFVLVLISYVVSQPNGLPTDAAVMQELKKSINPPPHGWDDAEPCLWQGVACTMAGVFVISIGDRGLTGGPLPQSLSTLTSLEILKLQGNQLVGPLPSLRGLNSLTTLRLNDNKFTSIPSDFFSGMSSLQDVYLDNNPFSPWGLFDSLKDSLSLITFSANNANIVGTIPNELTTLANLTMLDVSNNKICGQLPKFNSSVQVKTDGNVNLGKECPRTLAK